MPSLVITFLGKDRPGLVGRLSDVIREQQGNWLESRMVHLGDQFAGLVRVDVAADRTTQLVESLQALEADGLKVVAEVDSPTTTAAAGTLFELQVVGNDRPGIVREVTTVLSRHNINVEEFTTECNDAPQAGGRVFRASGRVFVPDGLSEGDLQNELEALATDLMIDFAPATSSTESGA